jgi:hypothetical protein
MIALTQISITVRRPKDILLGSVVNKEAFKQPWIVFHELILKNIYRFWHTFANLQKNIE